MSLKSDEDKILAMLQSLTSTADINVTQKNALEVGAVYACVNVISGSLGMLPFQMFHLDGNNRTLITDHPTAYMLQHEAFPDQTSQTVLSSLLANLVLRNNAFAEVHRNGIGQTVHLEPLETGLMSWDTAKENWLYTPLDGDRRNIAVKDIFHVKGFSLSGGMGADALSLAHQIIGLAIALDTNASKFFANGSRLGTILESEKSLQPEYRAELEKRLKEKHEGPTNAHRSIILENGLKAATNRSTNNDSQLDESRKHQIVDIARFYGVPPHKIGVMQNIPRANAEEANLAFITDVLQKYATMMEGAMNVSLLGKRMLKAGFYVKVNMAALLRGALKDRYEAFNTGRLGGWLSVNEIRSMEELDPIGPDGDIYLQPLNYVPAGTPPADPNAGNEGEANANDETNSTEEVEE